MPRFTRSDPVLRLERVIFRRLLYEGNCPKLPKKLVDEGRKLGYAYEQLLSGAILRPDGTPRLDLVEQHEAYVDKLVKASRWPRRLEEFQSTLTPEAWRDFEKLVQVGGVPFEIAEMIERYRSSSDPAAACVEEQQVQYRVGERRKAARRLEKAADALTDYSNRLAASAKHWYEDVAGRLQRTATTLKLVAKLSAKKPPRKPELRFCACATPL